jgi:aconitase B
MTTPLFGRAWNIQVLTPADNAGSQTDLPILADLMITDSDLAGDIAARRKRQLSCGYNYHLAYDGDRLAGQHHGQSRRSGCKGSRWGRCPDQR